MAKVADFSSAFPPAPAVMAILSRFDRPRLEGFITVAISLLDVLDGDPDEGDPLDEGEPAFDRRSRDLANLHEDWAGCSINGDGETSAWIERVDQTKPQLTHEPGQYQSGEDIEDDDPAGDAQLTDDSPGFDKRERKLANVFGGGAGCVIGDPDAEHDGDEQESWSHPFDHPVELWVGRRPDLPEAEPRAHRF